MAQRIIYHNKKKNNYNIVYSNTFAVLKKNGLILKVLQYSYCIIHILLQLLSFCHRCLILNKIIVVHNYIRIKGLGHGFS